MEANFYDINGNPLAGTTQTIVDGQKGLFYMVINIDAKNTGKVDLKNVRLQSATQSGDFSNDLILALQDPAPIPLLPVGGGFKRLWSTENACNEDVDCGLSERCVGRVSTCKIPIGNYIGEIQFGVVVEADSTIFITTAGDSSPTSQVVTSPLSLGAEFQPESILVRLEAKPTDSITSFQNTWLSYDIDKDGLLDSLGSGANIVSGIGCVGTGSPDFISFYGPFILQDATTSSIHLCQQGIDSDSAIEFKVGSANKCTDTNTCLNPEPIEPFTSQNCNFETPCQEIHTAFVTPQADTCFDSIKNQDETDIDCGGNSCSTCALNKACTASTDCASGLCSSNKCTETVVQGSNVLFRVDVDSYDMASICGAPDEANNEWIAFTDTCGDPLQAYGYVTVGRTRSNQPVSNCDTKYGSNNRMYEVPYNPSGNCRLSNENKGIDDSTLTAWLYNCQLEEGIGIYCICESDEDNMGSSSARFKLDFGDAEFAVTANTPTSGTEKACNP